jgi:hypothetical protein
VGKEDTGADDAEECGDCIQHGKNPKTQRIDLTARVATQSKEFRDKSNFESLMMILCNSCVSLGHGCSALRRFDRPIERARPGHGLFGPSMHASHHEPAQRLSAAGTRQQSHRLAFRLASFLPIQQTRVALTGAGEALRAGGIGLAILRCRRR